MKKEKNSNSGFTLIELIIAMAILAFLMTAVVSFMSAGVYSYKKAKADVSVHNNAQSVYNLMNDMTMQANSIVLLARLNTGSKVDFTVPGADMVVSESYEPNLSGLCYIVKDEATWEIFKETDEHDDSVTGHMLYEQIDPDTELYLKAVIIESGVDIMINECEAVDVANNKYKDNFAKGTGNDTYVIEPAKNQDETVKVDANGYVVYDTTDTQRTIFVFNGNNMYMERRFRFMSARDDYDDHLMGDILERDLSPERNWSDYLYCSSLSYVKKSDTENVSGVIAKVDANAGTIYYEFKFNDRNMTYESQGLAQIRNSYVLKPKSNRLEIIVGSPSEETSEEAPTED